QRRLNSLRDHHRRSRQRRRRRGSYQRHSGRCSRRGQPCRPYLEMIPFVDLKAQYLSIKNEIDSAIARVVESGWYILGPEVEAFEKAFAGYVGARFCIGVNSGTAALQLALMAVNIRAGDEVIVPANTFFATAEAVTTAGGTPVFVDADPVSYTIDISKIEAAITPKTRVIIPVHLYGQPANLDPLFPTAQSGSIIWI